MCIIEIYNNVGTVSFIQLGGSLLQLFMRLGESSVLEGPKKATLSHQGLLQAIGHLLVWYEWARNLASLPLWVGVQAASRLRRFVGPL